MSNVYRVAMADMGVARAPSLLVTIGLGSCVGVTMYDPLERIGALVHIMLPNLPDNRKSDNPWKFAERALPLMLDDLIGQGAAKHRLEAKLAGGAQMFANKRGAASDLLQVGPRNVEACLKTLAKMGIKVVARDTGGNHGRTLEFATATGLLRIKTIARGEKTI